MPMAIYINCGLSVLDSVIPFKTMVHLGFILGHGLCSGPLQYIYIFFFPFFFGSAGKARNILVMGNDLSPTSIGGKDCYVHSKRERR